MDGIIHAARGAVKVPFKDLFLILLIHPEREISLTDRAAENIHQ